MDENFIRQLIQARGIEEQYIDAWGNPTNVSDLSQKNALYAMGYQVNDQAALSQQIDQEKEEYWLNYLNPVQVNRVDETIITALRVPIELANTTFTVLMEVNGAENREYQFSPLQHELIGAIEIGETEYQEYAVELDFTFPMGYHQLTLLLNEHCIAQMRLIVTPPSCYLPDSIKAGQKHWGINVQLYCLRSESNWGIGDFSDLIQLVDYAASVGASFVGLNPLHALYPNNPDTCSPYSPSSRQWINLAYLDVEKVAGFNDEEAQQWFKHPQTQQKIQRLRQLELVDYTGVLAIKLEGLKKSFQGYLNQSEDIEEHSVSFDVFIQKGGQSLENQCIYDAIQEVISKTQTENWGWVVFPDSLKEAHGEAIDEFKREHGDLIHFYQFTQWQCYEQLNKAKQIANLVGLDIGLYGDIAVGVSEGSADTWSNPSLYCFEASIGAPPDVLGPLGQSWGLPPVNPLTWYEQAYQPFIDVLASTMQFCGAIRIDHVMGLMRLWWVSNGQDATQGSYVHYPLDDLLGILALESFRNKTLVIGEDLGTVPEAIRVKLANFNILSYRVFLFEKAADGGFISPSHYPEKSLSTLGTHDMPTLKGYWHCLDLVLGKELELYPDREILEQLYAARHDDKQRVLDSVSWHGWLPDELSKWADNSEMVTGLNHALHKHLATSSSALLSVQLEDWLEMDRPVNVPGTYNEYPNWRRKLDLTLTEIFSTSHILDLANEIDCIRKGERNGN